MFVVDHFNKLVSSLDGKSLSLYESLKHVRLETAYRARSFMIYQMRERNPVKIDEIVVLDFICDDEEGSSTEIRSRITEKRMRIGYKPVQIFGHPIMAFLPLHAQVKWNAKASNIAKGSLGFPLLLRTQSREHLRERGVTYMETGYSYAKEFESADMG